MICPLSREEEHDFDHIRLCSLDQSKLDLCSGDDQYIVYAMNRDETTHELTLNITEAIFHHLIITNRYIFDVHRFMVNKSMK